MYHQWMLSSFNVLRPLPLLLSPTLARCPWDIVWDSWSVCLLFVTLSVCQQCPSDPPPPCVGLPTFVGLPHYKSLGGPLDPLLPNVHIAIGSLPHMQDQLCRVDGRSVGENVDLDTGSRTQGPPRLLVSLATWPLVQTGGSQADRAKSRKLSTYLFRSARTSCTTSD